MTFLAAPVSMVTVLFVLPIYRCEFWAMKNAQKQDLARLLYIRGVVESQEELAARVGVTPVTISRWKARGNWEGFKKSMLVSRQDQLRRLYDQLDELTAKIEERPKGERYANNKEADIQSKLTGSIRTLETDIGVDEVVDVFKKFFDWMRSSDPSKIRELVTLFDSFVKTF